MRHNSLRSAFGIYSASCLASTTESQGSRYGLPSRNAQFLWALAHNEGAESLIFESFLPIKTREEPKNQKLVIGGMTSHR
jgi:hypothetical protein